jgi:hypothetical protein
MAPQYASQQPSGYKNHVSNIAIVGAGGQVGEYFTKHLLSTGKHTITALTREDSTTKLPSGVTAKKINYSEPSTLVSALQGQDVLIITMAVTAPPDTQTKLIDAAAEAGVRWIFPNEYSSDPTNESLQNEIFLGPGRVKIRKYIESLGASSWIGFVCSFWYEYSLAASPNTYGFDFAKKEVTFYDKGETKINTTTWEQCGRAMAAMLSLKVLPEDENDKEPTLSMFKNEHPYVSSFLVSQRDMFESVLRVTGDKESDWTVKYEDVKERYQSGMKLMQEGDRQNGFGRLLYARVFYPGDGDYESKVGLHNKVLGLPEEDFDEATKRAVDLAAEGGPFAKRR